MESYEVETDSPAGAALFRALGTPSKPGGGIFKELAA
jgi:hypothetical protein